MDPEGDLNSTIIPICNSEIKPHASPQRRYRMTFITQQTYLETRGKKKNSTLYSKTHQSSADLAQFF